MRYFLNVIIISTLVIPILVSCDDSTKYKLTVSKNPNDAGIVAPNGGDYDEGKSITIRATPNGDWQFQNWSGDISSTDNPVDITMNKDYEITANFSDKPIETFSVGITVTDGVYSENLNLVSDDNGTVQNGMDQDDREGPPIAPPGAFFTGSKVDNMNLLTDVRPAANRIVWELRLNRASGETITLEDWTISNNKLNGSLTLVDDPDDSTPNIELDMKSASNYSISDPSIQSLFVVYSVSEPAKIITGINESGIELELNERDKLKIDELKERENNTNDDNQFKRRNY